MNRAGAAAAQISGTPSPSVADGHSRRFRSRASLADVCGVRKEHSPRPLGSISLLCDDHGRLAGARQAHDDGMHGRHVILIVLRRRASVRA